MICKDCLNHGTVWRRLKGYGPTGEPIDDGKPHPVLCTGSICQSRRRGKPKPE
jgi:hypothetical protein